MNNNTPQTVEEAAAYIYTHEGTSYGLTIDSDELTKLKQEAFRDGAQWQLQQAKESLASLYIALEKGEISIPTALDRAFIRGQQKAEDERKELLIALAEAIKELHLANIGEEGQRPNTPISICLGRIKPVLSKYQK